MKRFLILILAILIISLTANAQDVIAPPAGYMDSCNSDTSGLLLRHFGPNCINPVTWDLAGMPRIGTWMSYVADDGSQTAGWLLGFSWQFQETRYWHYIMRPLTNSIYLFSFEAIPPERVR